VITFTESTDPPHLWAKHNHMKQEEYYPHKLTGVAVPFGCICKNSVSVHTDLPHEDYLR